MTAPVPFDVDLGKYLTEEQLTELDELYKEYGDSTGNIGSIQGNITSSMESYLYNYLGNLYYISKLSDKLKELNPNLTIIYVSVYNPYKNINIEIESINFNLGDIYDMVPQFVNNLIDYDQSYLSKVINVTLGTVESVFDREVIDSGITPNYVQIFQSLMKNPRLSLPSDNGHVYIKDTIINRMNNVCNHEAENDDNDCTTDVLCKLCGVVMESGNVDHIVEILPGVDPTCKETGLTEGAYCKDCGKVIKIRQPLDKLPHTYSSVCDEKCDVCNLERSVTHSYSEYEVIKEPTRKENGEEVRTCTVCGAIDFRSIPKTKGCKSGSIIVFISLLLTSTGAISLLYKKNN